MPVMAVQSKEMAYTMEYPAEKLNFRDHFSSLLLSMPFHILAGELYQLAYLNSVSFIHFL